MPTIKINTSGLVITKGGLPSCACCGVCSPDVTTVYVEYIDDPYGTPSISYLTLTGGLNVGLFSGSGPNGPISMAWNQETWVLEDSLGRGYSFLFDRCDPQFSYTDEDDPLDEWHMTVSFTPLP